MGKIYSEMLQTLCAYIDCCAKCSTVFHLTLIYLYMIKMIAVFASFTQ